VAKRSGRRRRWRLGFFVALSCLRVSDMEPFRGKKREFSSILCQSIINLTRFGTMGTRLTRLRKQKGGQESAHSAKGSG
jgi:hypothetical protein